MTSAFTFDIIERIGKIGPTKENGWTKELNIVSWNGDEPRFDIREWNSDCTRMSRGITLRTTEMKAVMDLLADRF